jgi:hypothetical protein
MKYVVVLPVYMYHPLLHDKDLLFRCKIELLLYITSYTAVFVVFIRLRVQSLDIIFL